MSNNLSRIFFLTGSSRGLGRSLAEAILEAGNQLIATARQPKQLEYLVQRYGECVLPLAVDVTDYKQAQAAMQQGAKHFGGLDVVINNAGAAIVGSIEDLTPEQFPGADLAQLHGSHSRCEGGDTDLPQTGTRPPHPGLIIGDRIATPGASAYYASKWAVAGFCRVACP